MNKLVKLTIMVSKIKNNHAFQSKPQRISDKEMRELLTKLKKEADKSPEEKGSFSLEVICHGKDMKKK